MLIVSLAQVCKWPAQMHISSADNEESIHKTRIQVLAVKILNKMKASDAIPRLKSSMRPFLPRLKCSMPTSCPLSLSWCLRFCASNSFSPPHFRIKRCTARDPQIFTSQSCNLKTSSPTHQALQTWTSQHYESSPPMSALSKLSESSDRKQQKTMTNLTRRSSHTEIQKIQSAGHKIRRHRHSRFSKTRQIGYISLLKQSLWFDVH